MDRENNPGGQKRGSGAKRLSRPKAKILVTGGCGYIGSHTIVSLLEGGHQVLSADDLSRSDGSALEKAKRVTGVEVNNYRAGLKDRTATEQICVENPEIEAVIHFAAYAYVGESVKYPAQH